MKPKIRWTGILGTLVGALLGGIVILMFDLFRYGREVEYVFEPALSGYWTRWFWICALLCGCVFSFCTLGGCRLLGGPLHGQALALCTPLLVVVPAVADAAVWTRIVMYSFNWDAGFFYRFSRFFTYFTPGLGYPGGDGFDPVIYASNLSMLYTGVIVGAIGAFFLLKKPKE